MATVSDRSIFIGTSDGIYQAKDNAGTFQAHPVGLQGMGAVRSMLVDARNPGRMYATSTKTGFWRSDDRGESWQEINQGIIYKEAWSLAQNLDSGTLYAGTGPSSIFKSTDGGDTWSDCEKLRSLPETIDWTFPPPPHISHVKGLDIRGERVLGAVEEGWIVRSTDGGETWDDIKDGTNFDAHYVISMPDNPEVVIHTAGQGVYKSVDGGLSFADAMEGLDRTYMAQVIVHPKRPRVLYTAASEVPPPFWSRKPLGANSGVYRSEDQGDSWARLMGGLPEVMTQATRSVAGDSNDPDVFVVGTFPEGTVWMTENGGESFRLILEGIPSVNSLLVVHN